MNKEVLKSIAILEKITGKKVIVESDVDVDFEDAPLSNRQLGAKKATATKGFDDWTKEQYAFAYALMTYGASSLRTMQFQGVKKRDLAASIGVKQSSFDLHSQQVLYVKSKGTEGLETVSPKQINYVNQFMQMSKQQVINLALKAVADNENKQAAKNKPEEMKNKLSLKNLTPEQRARINAIRAEKGMPPLAEAKLVKHIKNVIDDLSKL